MMDFGTICIYEFRWKYGCYVGARFNDGNGFNSGHVRIFNWNGSNWVQLGSDIDGEAASDFEGSICFYKCRWGYGCHWSNHNNDGNGSMHRSCSSLQCIWCEDFRYSRFSYVILPCFWARIPIYLASFGLKV